MKFVVVAHKPSETNVALAGAAASLGLPASVLPPRDSLRNLEPGDIALGRLDVREDLDGIETGTEHLERCAASGVNVLNPPCALVAAHDKLLTARALRRAGLPHPRTWLIAEGAPTPAPELPVVLKPRFGSWGRDVVLCRTADEVEDALAELTPTEFRLLYQLALERGRVVTRDELLQKLWGRRELHRDRTVDVFVRRLREKIDARASQHTFIQTRYGVGYRLEPVPK